MPGFLEAATAGEYEPPALKPRVPLSWVPGVDTERGEAVLQSDRPLEAVDWSGYLSEWGFDPATFTIKDDELQVRTWDSGDRRLWYYKATIVRKLKPDRDMADLLKQIRSHRPVKTAAPGGDRWLVVALSDWQIGKRDGGGTQAVVDRVLELASSLPPYLRQLRASGTEIGGLFLVGLGDLVEGCTGSYPSQEYAIEYDRRDQVKVTRRLIVKLIQTWAPLFPKVTVTAVPGNHGENVQRGRAFTAPGDNDDVSVVEQVGEILSENPDRYGHVRVAVPRDDTSVVFDLGGVRVGAAHGHLMGGRAAGDQAWRWWKDQAHAGQPIGGADLLLTGHYHHLRVLQQGQRMWVQAPSLDASDWFVDRHGYRSEPGVLTLTVGPGGWDHLRVL